MDVKPQIAQMSESLSPTCSIKVGCGRRIVGTRKGKAVAAIVLIEELEAILIPFNLQSFKIDFYLRLNSVMEWSLFK